MMVSALLHLNARNGNLHAMSSFSELRLDVHLDFVRHSFKCCIFCKKGPNVQPDVGIHLPILNGDLSSYKNLQSSADVLLISARCQNVKVFRFIFNHPLYLI
jgi:hypothetical protein